MLKRQIADAAEESQPSARTPLPPLRRNRGELRAAGRRAAGLLTVKNLTMKRNYIGKHAHDAVEEPAAELPAAELVAADLPAEPEESATLTTPDASLASLLEPLPGAPLSETAHEVRYDPAQGDAARGGTAQSDTEHGETATEHSVHTSPVATLEVDDATMPIPLPDAVTDGVIEGAALDTGDGPAAEAADSPSLAPLTPDSQPPLTGGESATAPELPEFEAPEFEAPEFELPDFDSGLEPVFEAEPVSEAEPVFDAEPTPEPMSAAEAEPNLEAEAPVEPPAETIDFSALSAQLAQQSQLPAVDLSEYPVQADAVALVPEQICRRSRLIPITRLEDRLMVAMVDPSDVVAIDDVSRRTGLTVVPLVADARSVSQAIDRYHRVDSELAELSTTIATEASEFLRDQTGIEDGVIDGDDDAPIIRFVNLLISQAIMDHASDIHIEPRRSGLHVRYRIDGVLHDVQQASRTMVAGVISRLKVMANLDIAERRRPQDGRISISQAGRSVDLRVATLPTVWGEKIVMRILDTQASTRVLGDLQMSDRNLDIFRASFSKPHGMVLVTGPTGSGKSTTLYTALGEVSTTAVNVITIEDPVEYRMEGVNQVQVNTKAGLTFASALRSILRSDPDVVLLGEIRDRETAQIAIEASLTGHLVLSTLHTNNAASAVTRLVEMGIEPFLVGSAVECVVAQRLARKLCLKCREPMELDDDRLAALNYTPADATEKPTFWKPVGCHSCSNTGYAGRLAVHEVLHVDEQIERLAVSEASAGEIATYAISQGMVTLRQDGLAKAAAGLTTIDEVLRVTA